jgi:hypothetical protein
MKQLTLGLLLCAFALSIGCKIGPAYVEGQPETPTAEKLAPAVKTAAMVGTVYALKEHPEWRPHFVTAVSELAILENAETIDFPTIMAIVMRLPVKELQSDEAQLAITGATILLAGYGDRLVNLENVENVRLIAKSLREGITLGIS